jgi:hypothetical protein
MLLPFIEQMTVYSGIVAVQDGSGSGANSRAPWDGHAYRHHIPPFMCPSESHNAVQDHTGATRHTFPTNYRMNRGDMGVNWDWDEGRGVFAMGDRVYYTLTTITDGTSNTLMFAEGVIGVRANADRIVGGIAINRDVRTRDDRPVRPIDWLAVRGQGNDFAPGIEFYNHPTEDWYLGRRWGDAHTVYTGIFTILPPNSPTVSRNPEYWCIPAASSYHPGGVGTVACDASYRFISNSISTGDLSAAIDDVPVVQSRHANDPQWYTGPSLYGVWGAYGTPAHGDSASL